MTFCLKFPANTNSRDPSGTDVGKLKWPSWEFPQGTHLGFANGESKGPLSKTVGKPIKIPRLSQNCPTALKIGPTIHQCCLLAMPTRFRKD